MLRTGLIALLIFFSSSIWAQPGDPGGDPGNVPISGIGILIALGAAMGIRYFKNKKDN